MHRFIVHHSPRTIWHLVLAALFSELMCLGPGPVLIGVSDVHWVVGQLYRTMGRKTYYPVLVTVPSTI